MQTKTPENGENGVEDDGDDAIIFLGETKGKGGQQEKTGGPNSTAAPPMPTIKEEPIDANEDDEDADKLKHRGRKRIALDSSVDDDDDHEEERENDTDSDGGALAEEGTRGTTGTIHKQAQLTASVDAEAVEKKRKHIENEVNRIFWAQNFSEF